MGTIQPKPAGLRCCGGSRNPIRPGPSTGRIALDHLLCSLRHGVGGMSITPMSPCVSGFGVPVSPSGFCKQPCVNILVARMIRCCCLRGPLKLSGAGQVAGAAPAHGTPATDLLIRYVPVSNTSCLGYKLCERRHGQDALARQIRSHPSDCSSIL